MALYGVENWTLRYAE